MARRAGWWNMGSWSIKWRILTETVFLVTVTAVAATLFDIAGAVVVGIAAIIIAAYRAQQLSRVFQDMTEGVLRTASVDRDYRLQPVGPAELDRIARAVNRLADRLVAAMQETARERTRLGSILDTMSEGVMLVDGDGLVEFANPASLALIGSPGAFRPGNHITALTNNYELNELASACVETGLPRQAQVDLRVTKRFVQALAAPTNDRDGRRKAVMILTDLTEVRKVETTRREFVSNASHELRTPISAIKAAAETLQRGAGDDPEVRADFLDRVLEDTGRLEAMVQEMLELSRLESGQTPLHMTAISPAELLEQAKHRFSPIAERSHISIVLDSAPGLPPISADPAKLEQVFANLIGNAVKAMPDGGTITLSARCEKDELKLSVADDGPGISSVHLPHIFERFYKVDSSRSSGGTGLGLAIAKHIVQAHGGEISVESMPGRGTKFTVTLAAG